MRNTEASTASFLMDTAGYLKQIQSVLRPSIFLAKLISSNGVSALVHCEDGFDVTSIVVALTKIQLDPFYRTIEGFLDLIEEDFASFGFRFMEKIGHSSKVFPRATEISYCPTFSLFLDAVYQISQQYACAFEFNESYLWSINEASCCGIFGKALC